MNRFVQVCGGADQEEEAPGPAKTGRNFQFRWCLRDSLHWQGKGREVLGVERWHAQSSRAGQADLSESAPTWGGTTPQYPPNPIPAKTQKKDERDKGAEKCFFQGLGQQIQKKQKTNTSVDAKFQPVICLAFPPIHSTPHHWKTLIPSHRSPYLAQKKFGFYGRYYGTVYTVPCQGNHYSPFMTLVHFFGAFLHCLA